MIDVIVIQQTDSTAVLTGGRRVFVWRELRLLMHVTLLMFVAGSHSCGLVDWWRVTRKRWRRRCQTGRRLYRCSFHAVQSRLQWSSLLQQQLRRCPSTHHLTFTIYTSVISIQNQCSSYFTSLLIWLFVQHMIYHLCILCIPVCPLSSAFYVDGPCCPSQNKWWWWIQGLFYTQTHTRIV